MKKHCVIIRFSFQTDRWDKIFLGPAYKRWDRHNKSFIHFTIHPLSLHGKVVFSWILIYLALEFLQSLEPFLDDRCRFFAFQIDFSWALWRNLLIWLKEVSSVPTMHALSADSFSRSSRCNPDDRNGTT